MTRSRNIGRGRPGIERGPVSIKDGKKLCRGKLHPPGGEWLPLERFKKYGKSKYYESRCAECERARRLKNDTPYTGYVPLPRYWWVFHELIARVGKNEAMRRTGIPPATWRAIIAKRRKNIQKKTLVKAMIALKELRESNVVRHKKDIRYGTYLRGKEERTPSNYKDFYSLQDDHAAVLKREQRKRGNTDTE